LQESATHQIQSPRAHIHEQSRRRDEEQGDDALRKLEDRTFIGTFHSFCTDILQQHGTHIGIQNDFTIYSLDDDRRQSLETAIKNDPDAAPVGHDEDQILKTIDTFMSRFIAPEAASKFFGDGETGRRYAKTYASTWSSCKRSTPSISARSCTRRIASSPRYPALPHDTKSRIRIG